MEKHRSRLAAHPDVGAVLPLFVKRLPGVVGELRAAAAAGDDAALRRLAHQLKGSGATYGFPEITELATAVEGALGGGGEEVRRAVGAMVGYLEGVEGYG